MKKLIFILILLAPVRVWAGLIQNVQTAYQKTDVFQADFVQKTRVEVLDRDVEEKGELTFAKPGKFSVHYKGSKERRHLSNGKTLWIYSPKDREVQVFENVKDLVAREALVFLDGLGNMTREFRVKELPKFQLELVPLKKSSVLKKLILTIDPKTCMAREVTLFTRSGNVSRYVFSNIELNEKISKDFFEFHEKNVKVVRP